jgi:hypothetical protein
VTFSASVDPATATGTLQFQIDGNPVGAPVALSSGSAASQPINNLLVGDHTVTAIYSGDPVHLSGTANLTQNVARADQTISFGALADQVFGAEPITLSASASSGLPVSFVLVSGPATLVGSQLTLTGAGTVSVHAEQAGDASFNPATPVVRSFAVTAASAQVSISDLAQSYDGSAHAVTVTTVPAGLDVTLTYSGLPSAPVHAGTYAVVAQIADPRYTGQSQAELVVAQRPVQATVDPHSKVYGNDDPPFAATLTSGTLVSGDNFIGNVSRDTGQHVGSYAIHQGTLSLGSDYSLSFQDGQLTIQPRPVAATADPKSKLFGESDPELTYHHQTPPTSRVTNCAWPCSTPRTPRGCR